MLPFNKPFLTDLWFWPWKVLENWGGAGCFEAAKM